MDIFLLREYMDMDYSEPNIPKKKSLTYEDILHKMCLKINNDQLEFLPVENRKAESIRQTKPIPMSKKEYLHLQKQKAKNSQQAQQKKRQLLFTNSENTPLVHFSPFQQIRVFKLKLGI
jgi:hypothetical protein